MHFTLLGKRWQILWTSRFDNPKTIGECDPPDRVNKAIRIKRPLAMELELDTIIHECLHAAAWHMFDEQYVTQAAADIARLLIRLGWRNDGEAS